ncbi:replication-relaxation family protein [Nocardia terpenica]|uniref:replication-relaxation family protein n=1 Tax=Nocardia terpenica TaxID=455432 RepID=UPI0015584AA7|nr:replication-relaxation family protein [Nocardia terpenica]NQE91713.1 replication-relaxation family protein [Nocardia terpenica]
MTHVTRRGPTRAHRFPPAPRRAVPAGQAALATVLTGRDRWLLWMLYEHRVLTTTQIAALAFTADRRASRRLQTLHQTGVIDRFRPRRLVGTAPWHWILAPAGAAVLAGEHGLDIRELRWRHDRALALAHSLRLRHDVAVNDWFTDLATTSPTQGVLTAWWSHTRCTRLWGDLARPDGYGRLDPTQPGLPGVEFFLEYDCGTESLTQVCGKLAGYANLATATGITTPLLLWLPTSGREAAARTALHATAAALPDPATVPIATAAADYTAAAETDPAGPVWLPLHPPAASGGRTRLALHRLTTAWPQPTGTTGPDNTENPAADRRTVLPPPPPRPPREATP